VRSQFGPAQVPGPTSRQETTHRAEVGSRAVLPARSHPSNPVAPSFSRILDNLGNRPSARRNPYSVNLAKSAITIWSGTAHASGPRPAANLRSAARLAPRPLAAASGVTWRHITLAFLPPLSSRRSLPAFSQNTTVPGSTGYLCLLNGYGPTARTSPLAAAALRFSYQRKPGAEKGMHQCTQLSLST
jgi:hypothetical protein